MMKRNASVFCLLLAGFALGSTGCGSTATVKLQFSKSTAALSLMEPAARLMRTPWEDVAASATSAPSKFQMKLIAAYLSEDIDPTTYSNVGNTTMIFLNSTCEPDLMHCDISGGTSDEDGGEMSLIVTDYFDLTDPTTANAAINSRDADVGTYKYVRLEFCKYNKGSAKNIKWSAATYSDQEYTENTCAVNSAVMDPPLTVESGDTITVSLGYSVDALISTGDTATGSNCAGSGATMECFTLPTFSPTATK